VLPVPLPPRVLVDDVVGGAVGVPRSVLPIENKMIIIQRKFREKISTSLIQKSSCKCIL
jgi:hypothetical protein